MIDVVFQLILFFMLTSSLVRPNQIELNLPDSTSGVKAVEETVLVIAYRLKDGKTELKLNDNVVASMDELGSAMRAASDPKLSPRVDLRIDKTVPYQDVISLMDAVRDAGFPKFSLLTLGQENRKH